MQLAENAGGIIQKNMKRSGTVRSACIVVENTRGRRQKSVAFITERVHPEVVASSQHKLRKGIDFNEFATLEGDSIDFVNGAIDACILVKVNKAETPKAET